MKYNISLLLCLTLFFTGCTQNDTEELQDKEVPIRFEIGIQSSPDTRMETDVENFTSVFTSGDAVGLFAVLRKEGTSAILEASGNHIHNVKLTYDGTNWNPETPIYFPGKGYVLDFYAYYPYNALNTDPTNIEYDMANMYDLMSARALNKSKGVSPVQLTFQHKLAMAFVKLNKDINTTGFYSNYENARIFNVKNRGTLNLSEVSQTNEFKTDINSTISYIQTNRSNVGGSYSSDTCEYTFYLPPQTIPAGRLFQINIDSYPAITYKDYNTTAKTFTAGKVTPFHIFHGWGIDPEHVYALGDPYPHVGPPVGIVYKITDGVGKHGKVVTQREFNARWGVDKLRGCSSSSDGKLNTDTWIVSMNYNYYIEDHTLDRVWRENGYTYTPALFYRYIPSTNEMIELINIWKSNSTFLQNKLNALGLPDAVPLTPSEYWTSTEASREQTYYIDYNSGSVNMQNKSVSKRSRHIIAF